MEIKKGVKLAGLMPQMVLAAIIVEGVYRARASEAVITSGSDGKHKIGSKHYSGNALDFRVYNLPGYVSPQETGPVPAVEAELRQKLGDNYDVVFEGDHFHIEYDPK